ncbi:MAG TPA: efflux RND transporter periplasmic adaptor subunit [Bryobacteraceae bacterium]|nr:efflux RND transporter periplasmic adaptor subunit [Bryobacteraceae bacterium]
MKKLAFVIFVLLTLGAGFAGGVWYTHRPPGAHKGRTILYWVDPMHPAYHSDRPGIAPDCGMKLEPVYEEGRIPTPGNRRVVYYRDPKDHSYHSEVPGLNPATGNELEPVYELNVAQEKQQLLGVTYATVEPASELETIRASGRVVQDETKITRVHPKIEGWIYQVHADFTGQFVKAGDALLTIYSPEMLASEQELLVALRARDEMKASPSHEAYENSLILVEAARRRLELWDLSAEQIAELELTRRPARTVTMFSPASGFVMSRNAFPSQRVSPDTELFAIGDLSRVWIMADVFETDIQKIHEGQAAVIGQGIQAKVSYIQPQMDPTTRTMKVRLEVANPGLRLKPDMFVDVEFRVGVSGRLSVPADAVIDTGLRKTVYVDKGDGNLEARQVETGDRMGDRVQVLRGLRAGERVVASGTFLIDSEAQRE